MQPPIRIANVGLSIAALLCAGFVALPSAASAPIAAAPASDTPDRQTIRLGPEQLVESAGPQGDSQTTQVIETDNFDVAGLTWDNSADGAELEFSVRSRSGGKWSDWYELHDDDHGPDPGTAEADAARGGTDPLVAPDSGAIEIHVTGEPPASLQLDLVNADINAGDQATPMASSSSRLQPDVRTRAQWGADESIREPGNPDYGEIRGGFVHHTAGVNGYSREEVPGIIRSIYRYHVEGRGWRDIGYNFLIDRFGRMWEGRYGGMKHPVVGAHVSGYNTYSVGVAAMGTYSNNNPPSDMLRSFKELFAWKFTIHGVNPTRRVQFPGEKKLWTISGHRDGGNTECPGDRLYAKLSEIRDGTEKRVQAGVPLVGGGDADNDGNADMHTRKDNGTLWFHNGTGVAGFEPRRQVSLTADWNRFTAFVGGDFNGDANLDLIVRRRDGAMLFRRGKGGGGFSTATEFGFSTDWNKFTAFTPGDYNDDGQLDLLTRRRDGTMWIRRGMGTGKFHGANQIGTSATWASYTALIGLGDFDSDGNDDLAGRHKDGNLYLRRGTGSQTFRARQEIGTGTNWNNYTGLVDIRDFNNDATPDVLARDNRGRLWLHPGNGVGTFQQRERVGTTSTWMQYG